MIIARRVSTGIFVNGTHGVVSRSADDDASPAAPTGRWNGLRSWLVIHCPKKAGPVRHNLSNEHQFMGLVLGKSIPAIAVSLGVLEDAEHKKKAMNRMNHRPEGKENAVVMGADQPGSIRIWSACSNDSGRFAQISSTSAAVTPHIWTCSVVEVPWSWSGFRSSSVNYLTLSVYFL